MMRIFFIAKTKGTIDMDVYWGCGIHDVAICWSLFNAMQTV
jgi:hypothetical protein